MCYFWVDFVFDQSPVCFVWSWSLFLTKTLPYVVWWCSRYCVCGVVGGSVWLYLIQSEFVLVGMLFRAYEWACVRACVNDPNVWERARERERRVGDFHSFYLSNLFAGVWGRSLWLLWWYKWSIVPTKEQHSSVGILGFAFRKSYS